MALHATGLARRPFLRGSLTTGLLIVAGIALSPAPVSAQSGRGFLFRAPRGAVALQTGFDSPRAGSDIFGFLTDELTIARSDFRTARLGADVDVRLRPRVGLVVSGAFAKALVRSEFRHWLDNEDLPIEQNTRFLRLPMTAAVKGYVRDPGQRISALAWIPARLSVYGGAGGGVMFYRLAQDGDFIDFNTLKVFFDRYDSSGLRPMVVAFGGAEIAPTPRVGLKVEARYEWASARLAPDFSGFAPMDLSGVAVTTGVFFRY